MARWQDGWGREKRTRLVKLWVAWRHVIRVQRARLVNSLRGWQHVVLLARCMPAPLACLQRTRLWRRGVVELICSYLEATSNSRDHDHNHNHDYSHDHNRGNSRQCNLRQLRLEAGLQPNLRKHREDNGLQPQRQWDLRQLRIEAGLQPNLRKHREDNGLQPRHQHHHHSHEHQGPLLPVAARSSSQSNDNWQLVLPAAARSSSRPNENWQFEETWQSGSSRFPMPPPRARWPSASSSVPRRRSSDPWSPDENHGFVDRAVEESEPQWSCQQDPQPQSWWNGEWRWAQTQW